jgi:T5SS/PEP-CTERM-associated repeat protein
MVTVKGTGSVLTTGALTVRYDGLGSLDIPNKADVTSLGTTIGYASNQANVVTVDDATWSNGGLTVGDFGVGILNIKNAGTLTNSSDATLGNQAGSLGTGTIDGNNSVWTNTGDLTVGSAGTGVLNITNFGGVSTTGNLTIDVLATGQGTVNVGLNGTLAATGSIVVNRGLLAVNGAISAANGVTVNSGGTLTGNGAIISSVSLAQAGAVIAPGNLVTLAIAGNLTQTAGSIHEAEINAANQTSSLVHVAGSADIQSGAILKPVVVGGTGLKVGTHYTVLTAADGVTGTYTLANTAFLGFAASYDATNVYLDVTKSASFGSLGLTRNQIATGNAADTLGFGKGACLWQTPCVKR